MSKFNDLPLNSFFGYDGLFFYKVLDAAGRFNAKSIYGDGWVFDDGDLVEVSLLGNK